MPYRRLNPKWYNDLSWSFIIPLIIMVAFIFGSIVMSGLIFGWLGAGIVVLVYLTIFGTIISTI